MSFYFNIVNLNKGHIKEVCYLQDIVNKSMLKEDHYFPTDAKTIKKALKQDAIFLGVYANKDLIAASRVIAAIMKTLIDLTDGKRTPYIEEVLYEMIPSYFHTYERGISHFENALKYIKDNEDNIYQEILDNVSVKGLQVVYLSD